MILRQLRAIFVSEKAKIQNMRSKKLMLFSKPMKIGFEPVEFVTPRNDFAMAESNFVIF